MTELRKAIFGCNADVATGIEDRLEPFGFTKVGSSEVLIRGCGEDRVTLSYGLAYNDAGGNPIGRETFEDMKKNNAPDIYVRTLFTLEGREPHLGAAYDIVMRDIKELSSVTFTTYRR